MGIWIGRRAEVSRADRSFSVAGVGRLWLAKCAVTGPRNPGGSFLRDFPRRRGRKGAAHHGPRVRPYIQSMDSPGQNTGVGSLSLLQGLFLTQGSNQALRHCRRILYQLRYERSPNKAKRKQKKKNKTGEERLSFCRLRGPRDHLTLPLRP